MTDTVKQEDSNRASFPASYSNSRPAGPGRIDPERGFAEYLKTYKYHPVLLFGTQNSGKTAIILSLLVYAKYQSQMKAQVLFGAEMPKDLYPDTYVANNLEREDAQQLYAKAKSIFENDVPHFNAGFLPPSTQAKNPIFLPVRLIRGNNESRFLFVEGNGEWYSRQTNNAYIPFKNEILWLLKYFDGPISIIFVVPATAVTFGETQDYNQMTDSIIRCMDLYSKERGKNNQNTDRLLLISSQWDTVGDHDFAKQKDTDADITLKQYENATREWQGVWAGFTNLQSQRDGVAATMPYSIGEVQTNTSKEKPALLPRILVDSRSKYCQFPRILWNWLYCGATKDSNHLFDDVNRSAGIDNNFFRDFVYRLYAA